MAETASSIVASLREQVGRLGAAVNPGGNPSAKAPAVEETASSIMRALRERVGQMSPAKDRSNQEPTSDRMAALIRGMTHTESRDQQFDKHGRPLESTIIKNGARVPGAIGIAQIMRGTAPEAAKLAGLPYDEQRYMYDKDYNLALGSAYLKEQIRIFGGDEAKGVAAYNTGASNVRRAVSRANTKGATGNWLNHVAQETRDYVPGVLGRANKLYQPKVASSAPASQKLSDAAQYQDAWAHDNFAQADLDDDTTLAAIEPDDAAEQQQA